MRTHRLIGLGALAFWLLLAGGCDTAHRRAQLEKGYAALASGDFDAALSAASAFNEKYPTGDGLTEAMYLRGRALEQRQKPDAAAATADLQAARQQYQDALDALPAPQLRALILTSLGNVNYWLGDYPAAEEVWLDAYARLDDPALRGWVLYRIGLTQQRQGRWGDADRTFAVVESTYPNSEPARRAASARGASGYFVQVAAFGSSASAEKLVSQLRAAGYPARTTYQSARKLNIVTVGPLDNYPTARAYHQRLCPEFPDAFIFP